MSLLVLLNLALGAGLGRRFGVLILIPLMPVIILELALIEHATMELTWISVIWHAAALIAALEIGYLIGLTLRDRVPAQREAMFSR